jgi:hypothetical protein
LSIVDSLLRLIAALEKACGYLVYSARLGQDPTAENLTREEVSIAYQGRRREKILCYYSMLVAIRRGKPQAFGPGSGGFGRRPWRHRNGSLKVETGRDRGMPQVGAAACRAGSFAARIGNRAFAFERKRAQIIAKNPPFRTGRPGR